MSNITRNIPNGSTQAEIDAIVAEMILECATAIAQSRAVPCPGVTNDAVFFVHVCVSGVFTYTGTAPAWITVDAPNSQFIGAAGTYSGATKAEANSLAQAVIDAFGAAELASGRLTCATDFVSLVIQGYFDGLIPNPTGD